MKLLKYLIGLLFVMIAFFMQAQTNNCIDTGTVIVLEGPMIHIQDSIGTFGPHSPHENPETEEDAAPGEKVVFWLHGLGGNEMSWVTARTWTGNNYKEVGHLLDYSGLSGSNIDAAADEARTQMEDGNETQVGQEGYTRDKSILIAHSQGGVVARQVEWDILNQGKQREYGALATFGSPHHGAPIINNVPRINEYLDNTCRVIAQPIIFEAIYNIHINSAVFEKKINKMFKSILKNAADNFLDFTCSDVTGFTFDLLEESIAPPIGQDLAVGSQVINNLLNMEVEVPSVAFYGVEDEPVSWREIYSMNEGINHPSQDENNPNPPADDVFTADYDEGYIDLADDISGLFFRKYVYYKQINVFNSYIVYTLADMLGCRLQGGVVSGGKCWIYDEEETVERRELSDSFSRAYQWINDFNANYKILFGLGEFQDFTMYKDQCVCRLKYDPDIILNSYDGPCNSESPDQDPIHSVICNIELVPYQVTEFVTEPSDGVVPKSSAEQFPVKDDVFFDNYEMKHSNHQQMRNDHNTGVVLPDLFGGERYDKKFYIDRN